MKDDKNKNQFDKRRKDNKTLRKKVKRSEKKLWQKTIKKKEPKIKVSTHKLLAFTLSYLMLTPWWYTNTLNLSSRTLTCQVWSFSASLKVVFTCLQNSRSIFWWKIKIRCNHFNWKHLKRCCNFWIKILPNSYFLSLLEFLSPLKNL
jgi:hypothetical protein